VTLSSRHNDAVVLRRSQLSIPEACALLAVDARSSDDAISRRNRRQGFQRGRITRRDDRFQRGKERDVTFNDKGLWQTEEGRRGHYRYVNRFSASASKPFLELQLNSKQAERFAPVCSFGETPRVFAGDEEIRTCETRQLSIAGTLKRSRVTETMEDTYPILQDLARYANFTVAISDRGLTVSYLSAPLMPHCSPLRFPSFACIGVRRCKGQISLLRVTCK